MLAEVEYLRPDAVDLAPDDAPGKVDVVIHLRELGQLVNIVLQHFLGVFVRPGGILVELTHQHPVRGLGVLVGTVGLEVVLHLASAVELVRGSQITALHLVKDGLHVHQTALREVEVNACTQEFLGQQGHVEVVGVEARDVAAREHLVQLGGQLLEGRLVLHVVIRNACQLGNQVLDVAFGIDELVAPYLAAVGEHLNIR